MLQYSLIRKEFLCLKKLIVSFLCAIVVACTVLGGFCLLYFSIPSQKAKASISLPSTVEDSEMQRNLLQKIRFRKIRMFMWLMYTSLSHFVPKLAQILTRLQTLEPMTHLEVLEFTAGTNYAYVEVLSGEKKSYKGYVNSDYITKLGEPTVRIGTEE